MALEDNDVILLVMLATLAMSANIVLIILSCAKTGVTNVDVELTKSNAIDVVAFSAALVIVLVVKAAGVV